MKPIRFSAERLEGFFHDAKVATLPQLKATLGTAVDATVFRKLSTLPYRTSYSHRGAYYTLDTLAHYDQLGLWSYRDIHFSRHGTLLDTAATLVSNAPAGCFTDELEAVVHVAAKDALRQLVQRGRLSRRDWEDRYLYCAAERERRQQQWAARQAQQHPEDDLQAAILCSFTVCWTSSSGGSTLGWRAWSGATAAINGWPSCSGWMRTLWRAVGSSS
jgi:hypothetical protein